MTGTTGAQGATGAQGPTGTFGPVGATGETIYHDGTGWTNTGNLYNDGTNIGIGTTSPAYPLDVFTLTAVKAGNFLNSSTTGVPTYGVYGTADGAGTNGRYGGYFTASGATTSNVGMYSRASGAGATNYGVYVSASGGTSNWAGYFASGNVYIQNKLGIGTNAPITQLHVVGDEGVLFQGNVGLGNALNLGAGTRMHWYPLKAAFRAGEVNGPQWDDANVGAYSVSFGKNNYASGTNSSAFGIISDASGNNSFAAGDNADATGTAALASGWNTLSGGSASTAMGYNTVASGNYSVALGSYVDATAAGAVTIGAGLPAGGNIVNNIGNSFMMGFNSDVPTLFVGPGSGTGTFGNVGIGTTTPNFQLEVISESFQVLRLGTTSGNSFVDIEGAGTGGGGFRIRSNGGADNIIFQTAGLNDRMTITSTGNVGIGVTAPSATLDVVGTLQYADGSEGVNKVLTSDATGNATWANATNYLNITPPGCQVMVVVNTTPTAFPTALASFTKNDPNTIIEVDFQTHFYVDDLIGSVAVLYQLRIDGNPADGNTGMFTYWKDNAGAFVWTNNLSGTITATFSGLAVGAHSIELYVFTSAGGTAANVRYDPGCFGNIRNVTIKEIR